MFYQLWNKGKAIQASTEKEVDEESDSEPELMMVSKKPSAKLFVKIYKADGLLKQEECLWAQVRRRFLDVEETVDPYVEVSFNGLKGSTSRKRKTSSPVWKEQIVFTIDFPFPLNNIVVHVRDDEIVGHKVIGSVIIPLEKISNPRDNGFLPTFGPCYVYLRDLSAEENTDAQFRGRLLMAVSSEMLSYAEYSEPSASVELAESLPEGSYGYDSEFFLCACIHEASMINKKAVVNSDVRFSLQLGNYGRKICDVGETPSYYSASQTPMPLDKKYMYLSFEVGKAFLSMEINWPDNSRRLYASNILLKIVQHVEDLIRSLEDSSRNNFDLSDLQLMAKESLGILKEFEERYSSTTELDRERFRTFERDIAESLTYMCGTSVKEEAVEGILNRLIHLKEKLELLAENPQVMFPDIVLWLESDSKRIGFVTVPANHIFFALRDNERGRNCGKVQTFFLSPMVKKNTVEVSLMAKVECFFWLGPYRHQHHCLASLPTGISIVHGGDGDQTAQTSSVLQIPEDQVYEVRAHLYQARSLSYSSFSRQKPDCFAMVYVKNSSRSTQVAESSSSPVWDETLIVPGLLLDKMVSEVTIVVEILASERTRFLGRMITGTNLHSSKRLQWYKIEQMGVADDACLLAAFEIFKSDRREVPLETDIFPIPDDIRPHFSKYRLEVLFWGLREMKRVHFLEINRPSIEIECNDQYIRSDIIDYKKHSNFSNLVRYLDINLPDQEDYFPPLTIKLLSSSGFGRIDVVATHVVASLQTYVHSEKGFLINSASTDPVMQIEEFDENPNSYTIQKLDFPWVLNNLIRNAEDEEEEACLDWWARFYMSMNMSFTEETQTYSRKTLFGNDTEEKPSFLNKTSRLSAFSQHVFRVAALDNGFQPPVLNAQNARAFTVYDCELENVAEFNGLKQFLHSFKLKRGKRLALLKDKVVAIFKGCFRVYKLPLQQGVFDYELGIPATANGFFENVPLNNPVKVLVRAYIIQAIDLQPSDFTNTTDAYIVLRLGKHKISNRNHYVSKLLNPVFGKCYEFMARFPAESILHIQLYDWDLMGSDDLIGETTIDLENRFYSKHRATCGLARYYEKKGPNAWRDAFTPLEILKMQCQRNKIDGPHIRNNDIRIGNKIFELGDGLMGKDASVENFALCLLHRWGEICPKNGCLVQEHVETRVLYHPKKALKPQGRLVMWLDMFAEDQAPSSNPREIAKRKPDSYELRVIIWNTDSMKLTDDAFLTGERMSDIYVKGWLTMNDVQMTDVHYRSLTGDGNFNWRFVFPFDYLATERQIVVMKKMHVLSIDETEFKMPAHLQIEAWDADCFSADDPLGALTINLNRIPRGARTAKSCTLAILRDNNTPKVSLFKQKRVKGWWPLTELHSDGKMELTGKVEIEIHLLTAEEAEKSPVGLGRKEPDALPQPKRPETSFNNFLHPLKAFRYAFWKRYKWTTIKILAVAFFVLLLLLFFFALPGYAVKRLLGV